MDDLMTIHGAPGLMPSFHRHNDIEINFLERGSMTYRFSRGRRHVPELSLAVFWAMFPHRVVELEGDPLFYCLHIPLGVFLRWRLPPDIVSEVLHGNIVVDRTPSTARADMAQFPIWHEDIAGGIPERMDIVFLELEARLRRAAMSLTQCAGNAASIVPPGRPGESDKLASMAAFIAERYTDDVPPADVAAHVDLHPKYAMSLFRKAFDMTIVEYLTQLRISHAQRLLATTDLKIVDIAFDAGFGSTSRFYEAFSAVCGRTPSEFRAELSRPGSRSTVG